MNKKERTFAEKTFCNLSVRGRFYYKISQCLISGLVCFLWVRKVEGLEKIPKRSPFVIIPNHSSYLDFMLILFCLRKFGYFKFFIKAPYFDSFKWKHFLFHGGQIKADRTSIALALKALKKGIPIVLFAEGTRTKDGSIGKGYPGVGILARKMPETPIVPVGLIHVFDIWPWNKKWPKLLGRRIILRVGSPIFFEEGIQDPQQFTDLVMAEVEKLINQ